MSRAATRNLCVSVFERDSLPRKVRRVERKESMEKRKVKKDTRKKTKMSRQEKRDTRDATVRHNYTLLCDPVEKMLDDDRYL